MVKKGKTIIIVTLFITLIGGGFAGWYFFLPKPAETKEIFKFVPLQFNEVSYRADTPGLEWIELYYFGNTTLSIEGWEIESTTGEIIKLPDIVLHEFDYIAFHLGTSDMWPSEINRETHSIDVFLNYTSEILDNTEGGIILRDIEGNIIDTLAWGTSVTANFPFWSLVNSSLVALDNESLSIWGYNDNTSANWFPSIPTPALPNVFLIPVPNTNQTVSAQNGRINYIPSDGTYYIGKTPEKDGHPSAKEAKKKITEYATYSIDLYHKLGYGYPETGGDGYVNITFSNGTSDETSGSCDPDTGDIKIDIGKKKSDVSLKYTVEHEMFHTLQIKHAGGNGTAHETEEPEWWFDEGMAVWFGILSTMKNFKKSMVEVMKEFERVNDHNWFDHAKSLSDSPFSGWKGGYDEYIASFFLIKFIKEKYGEDKLKQIHETIEQYKNGTQKVSAKKSIEKVLGKSFEEILNEMNVWRVTEAPTANGAPQVTPDEILIHNDTHSVSDSAFAGPTEALLEEIDCSKATGRFNLTVKADGKMYITVILHKKDGTKEKLSFILTPPDNNKSSIIIDSSEVTKVQVIKFNPNLENSTLVELDTMFLLPLQNVTFTEVNFVDFDVMNKYVEIYNAEDVPVSTNGWLLHLAFGTGEILPLPNITIDPYQYLCIFLQEIPSNLGIELWNTSLSKYIFLHAPVDLDETFGGIELLDNESQILDSVLWMQDSDPQIIEDFGWDTEFPAPYCTDPHNTISRFGEDKDSGENWFETQPTPGLPNVNYQAKANSFLEFTGEILTESILLNAFENYIWKIEISNHTQLDLNVEANQSIFLTLIYHYQSNENKSYMMRSDLSGLPQPIAISGKEINSISILINSIFNEGFANVSLFVEPIPLEFLEAPLGSVYNPLPVSEGETLQWFLPTYADSYFGGYDQAIWLNLTSVVWGNTYILNLIQNAFNWQFLHTLFNASVWLIENGTNFIDISEYSDGSFSVYFDPQGLDDYYLIKIQSLGSSGYLEFNYQLIS
ncbi:hypothetical protein [Candidatus Harpocratesius sp.]